MIHIGSMTIIYSVSVSGWILAVDLVRDIEGLQNYTQDFVAAAHAGGRDAVRKKLDALAAEIKNRLADNLNTVAVKFGLNKMKELKT